MITRARRAAPMIHGALNARPTKTMAPSRSRSDPPPCSVSWPAVSRPMSHASGGTTNAAQRSVRADRQGAVHGREEVADSGDPPHVLVGHDQHLREGQGDRDRSHDDRDAGPGQPALHRFHRLVGGHDEVVGEGGDDDGHLGLLIAGDRRCVGGSRRRRYDGHPTAGLGRSRLGGRPSGRQGRPRRRARRRLPPDRQPLPRLPGSAPRSTARESRRAPGGRRRPRSGTADRCRRVGPAGPR